MIGDNVGLKPTLSSLPLQILIHFHWHYIWIFFVLTLSIFIYKSVKYYYPREILAWDLVTIFCYIIVESSRLFLASKGNKTIQIGPLAGSLFLIVPIVVLHAYYMTLQLYVLRAETVINSIAIIFLAGEFLISFFVLFSFFITARRF